MREAAVIGAPIAHSLSPAIFSFLSQRLGLKDFHYSAELIESGQLKPFLQKVRLEPSWLGLNVTIPHKETCMKELDDLSAEALAIGAVNVIKKQGTRLKGFNTDVAGVLSVLADFPQRNHAVLLGAGGAARAAAFAFGQMGFSKITVINRDQVRAQVLIDDSQKKFPEITFQFESSLKALTHKSDAAELIVNATPVGMSGKTNDADFFSSFDSVVFAKDAWAFDMIYTPEKTPFLSLAAQNNLHCTGGLKMLVQQAFATWSLWFGVPSAELQTLESELSQHLRRILQLRLRSRSQSPKPIYLTGFMGAGKSTVAQALALRNGCVFIDTDHLIERRTGMAVADFFAQHGEIEFRKIEKEVVQEVAKIQNAVISLGGGAILDQESQKSLRGSGTLIYLEANAATLEKRLAAEAAQGKIRPLLAGATTQSERLKKITDLLLARENAYRQAEFCIDTNSRDLKAVLDQIEEQVLGIPSERDTA